MDIKLQLFFFISNCHMLIIFCNYNKDVNSIETSGKHKHTQATTESTQQKCTQETGTLLVRLHNSLCMCFYLNLLRINNSHFYLFVHVKLKILKINYDTLLIMNRGTEKEESSVSVDLSVYTPPSLLFLSVCYFSILIVSDITQLFH